VVRFIVLPAIGIGIVKGAIHFGLIHPDPLYQFLLLLQFALPPAIALSKLFIFFDRISMLFIKLNNICFRDNEIIM